MRPILFSLGRLNFYSYGFFTALGFIVGGIVIDYLAKKKKLINKKQREYFLIDALLFALVIGILSARLGYIVLYSFIFRLESLALATNLIGGGFVFYIGLAAGLASFSWWIKRQEEPTMPWFDVLMPGILVGIGLSEVGGYLHDGSIVHLASMIGHGALVGISYAILVTERKAGQTFWVALFLLFLLHFFLGFWQLEKLLWYGLNFGQWINLIGIVTISSLAYRKQKIKK